MLIPTLALSECPVGQKDCPPTDKENCIPNSKVCLNLEYPEFGGFDPEFDQDLNQVVAWFYYFIVAISGFTAFYTIVIGGFSWLTSGGNASQIGAAKERMTSAFIGLIIILASFLILQLLNPELTTLDLPALKELCDTPPCGIIESP